MDIATVFEVDQATGLIAVEAPNGVCAVFIRVVGCQVVVGDVLVGRLHSKNPAELKCCTNGKLVTVAFGTGPIPFGEAMAIVGLKKQVRPSVWDAALH